MKAWAVCECGQPLQQLDLDTPAPSGTEVLLEVAYCGVCHSDLHIWDGYYDLGGSKRLQMAERGMTLPLAMGHEVVGRVARLGPEASGVNVGDMRIVYPWVGCGKCSECQSELDNMCQQLRSIGVYQHGGYGSHVIVPHSRHLVDLGNLDPAVAATYACSGITVHAALRKVLPLAPNESLVLVGAGGLGLAAISMALALGHKKIVVVEISPQKREAALLHGASDVVDADGEDVAARIIQACGGPVAAVVDFVNGSQSARFSFDSLRKGGKLIQVGLYGGDLTLPLPIMATRALTVQGSFVGSPADLRAVVALAQAGRLLPIPVELVPQDDANEALVRLREGTVTGRLVLHAELP
jgi:alcohol dehydrogenase/propanol-preferring alcohol dehydrogenase